MAIKVLVFGMTDNPGGMESCIMNYFRNIDPKVIHFDFLCNWEQMIYKEEVVNKGSKVYTIPQKSNNYNAYRKAMDIFFKEHAKDYDVLWYNTCTLTNIDYLIYAEKYGIGKRIIHAHNSANETSAIRGALHHINKKRIEKYATDFWSCSLAASHYFYRENIITSCRHHIINNAIATEKYQYNENIRDRVRKEFEIENCCVVGHVGRFQYQKNHEFLVELFNEYLKMNPEAALMLVGQGEGENSIRQKVTNLGIADKVLFMGGRSDVNELLQAMDLFVFPSRFEGFGMVLVEAQAAGLRCITSKDKVPQEVDMTGNVKFVELKDNPQEWAQNILNIEGQMYNRKGYMDEIAAAGYDIKMETSKFISYLCEE